MFALSTSLVSAQRAWENRAATPPFSFLSDVSAAMDERLQRIVCYGAYDDASARGETWEWDGRAWSQKRTTSFPVGRGAMAYDSVRRRPMYFGGWNLISGLSDETWSWSGADWERVASSVRPPARVGASLAFDAGRGRLVLFGGLDDLRYRNDTWEWDGSTWIQRSPSVRPPRGAGGSGDGGNGMVYDAARGRVVLFGGIDATTLVSLGETWEWDGTNWSRRNPAVSPPARKSAPLSYDAARGVVVLCGGIDDVGPLFDTWEWNGVSWVQRPAPSNTSYPSNNALVYDVERRRTVLFAGWHDEVWEWDGSIWARAGRDLRPAAETRHAMVYDSVRRRIVLFGGLEATAELDETWEWDGAVWTQRQPLVSPPGRSDHAMVFDASRGRVVLFGGRSFSNPSGDFDDTWEWDGAVWQQRSATLRPPALSGHSMAFDSARARTVLFAGSSGTWEWDGGSWSQRVTNLSPSAELDTAMAYDVARGRVVLFGGLRSGGGPASDETWEWDGTQWTRRATSFQPAPRSGSALVYDAARRTCVLFGGKVDRGIGFPEVDAETWEWNGSRWTQLMLSGPQATREHALSYDARRDRIVLHGGEDRYAIPVAQTWELASSLASITPFGSACLGSGEAALRAEHLPYAGQVFRLQLHSLPSNRPAFLALGGSGSQWLGVPLPFDLGLPGCAVQVALDVILPTSTSPGGSATMSLVIPNDRALVGASLFAQGLCLDPAANSLGLISPSPLRGVVGR